MGFKEIQSIETFEGVFNHDSLEPVPESWHIVITDIKGSTRAIEAGKYKEVNTAGGLAVIAVANAFKDMEFPFVFGGDGVTILIPDEIKETVKDVLYDTSLKVRELYDLELRVGVVSVKELKATGHHIKYGKLKISQYYDQVILFGDGVDVAEEWVKKRGDTYLITSTNNPKIKADFTGFTCRWEDIQSHKGETIALIVKARNDTADYPAAYYSELMSNLMEIMGDVVEHHPIQENKLQAGTSYIKNEALAHSGSKSGAFFKKLKIRFEMIFTNLAMRFNIKLKAFWYELNNLKQYQIISSDYRKYDGTLKMIVSISSEQRQKLESYLVQEYQKGNIFFGLHVSDRALMTCLLHSGSEKEVHFVDAADGGYALAAKQLKKQVAGAL